MRPKVVTTLVAAMFVVLAACSPAATATPTAPTETASPPAATSTAAATATTAGTVSAGCESGGSGTAVTVADFAFDPAALTVKVGTTVTWTNQDSVGHTATADDGSFDCRPLSPSASLSFTFQTAGTFPYSCAIHPSMKGTITVNP